MLVLHVEELVEIFRCKIYCGQNFALNIMNLELRKCVKILHVY